MNGFRHTQSEVWCPSRVTTVNRVVSSAYDRILSDDAASQATPVDVAVAVGAQARFWLSVISIVSDGGNDVCDTDTMDAIVAVAPIHEPVDRERLDGDAALVGYDCGALCQYLSIDKERDIDAHRTSHGRMFDTEYPESRLVLANECENSTDALVRADLALAAHTAQHPPPEAHARRGEGSRERSRSEGGTSGLMSLLGGDSMWQRQRRRRAQSAASQPEWRRPMGGLDAMVDTLYWRVMPLARAAVYRWVAGLVCMDAPRISQFEMTILYRTMTKLSLAADPERASVRPLDLPSLFGSPHHMRDRANTHSSVPWDTHIADMDMRQVWRTMRAAADVSVCVAVGQDAVAFVRAMQQRIATLFSYTYTMRVLNDPEYIELAPGQSETHVRERPEEARLVAQRNFVYHAMCYLRPMMDTVCACHYMHTVASERCADEVAVFLDAIHEASREESRARRVWMSTLHRTTTDENLNEFVWIKINAGSWESRLRWGERERYMVGHGTHSVKAQQIVGENRRNDTDMLYEVYEKRALGVKLWNLYDKERRREMTEEVEGEQRAVLGDGGSLGAWRGQVQMWHGWPWMTLPDLMQHNMERLRKEAPQNSDYRTEVDEMTGKTYVIETRTNRIVVGHRREAVMRERVQTRICIDRHEFDRISMVGLDIVTNNDATSEMKYFMAHPFYPPTRYKVQSTLSLDEKGVDEEEDIDVRRDAPEWIRDSKFRSACAERGIMLWALARSEGSVPLSARKNMRILYFGHRYYVTDGDVCVAATADIVAALVANAHAHECIVARELDNYVRHTERYPESSTERIYDRALSITRRVPRIVRHMAGIARCKTTGSSVRSAANAHHTRYDAMVSPESDAESELEDSNDRQQSGARGDVIYM